MGNPVPAVVGSKPKVIGVNKDGSPIFESVPVKVETVVEITKKEVDETGAEIINVPPVNAAVKEVTKPVGLQGVPSTLVNKEEKKITFAGQKSDDEKNTILNGLFSVVGGYVDSKHKGEVLAGWRHVLKF